MKTIQFILIFVCFGLSVGQAQTQTQAQTSENLPHKPLASFKSNAQMSDTLQYLEYNFHERQSQYIGKTVTDVLKDIKLPYSIASSVSTLCLDDCGDLPSKLTGIYIGIKQLDQFGNDFNELIDYYVLIEFVDPPLADDFRKVFQREEDTLWGQATIKRDFDPCPEGWRLPTGGSTISTRCRPSRGGSGRNTGLSGGAKGR